MSNVTANGIKIEYDTFGDRSSLPLLLIMGLGTQMIYWEDEFCEELARQGHYVIRFDNRDTGLSSKFEDAGVPDIVAAITAALQGNEVKTPYILDDMADDAMGLLDSLNIEKAHICGISMGGMIAQTIAYRHPSRILSLISIMSSTGDPGLPQGKREVMAVLMTPAPAERQAYIEYSVKLWQTISGAGFSFDEENVRNLAVRAYERNYYPRGIARQLVAIIAHGNRKSALKSVTTPTLVIHGSDDPLIPVECGRDTADAVPGAELMIIEGMGHNLPREVWPRVIENISKHTHRSLV